MGKKLTQEEVIKQFREVHGDKYDYSKVKYANAKTKVEIVCPIHGSFYQIPHNHKQGNKCPYCVGRKTHINDSIGKKRPDLIEYFINEDDAFKYAPQSNKKIKVKCPECGFAKMMRLQSLVNQDFHCDNCNSFKNNYPELMKYLINKEDGKLPKKSGKKVKVKCLNCGFEKIMFLSNLSRNKNYPHCENCNSFENNYPELTKYLVDAKDGKLFKSTNKKVKVRCLDCGFEKMMKLNHLAYYKFSCPKCSDGVSVPEKFMSNLLSNLNIDFETQYSPKWIGNKRYDFYIDDLEMIIETHGTQHYNDSIMFRSLQEEQENDRLKKTLAFKNGIKNYIVVDCRKSTLKWLKENCLKELSLYFDLSDVDWNKVWDKSQNSLVKEVCEAWNNKREDEATKDIIEKFNSSASTVYKYLNKGKELGWCNYGSKTLLLEHKLKLKKINSKKVCQYTKNGDFIEEYPSMAEASRQMNISSSIICECCQGKRKTAGGYIWKYAEQQ